MAIMVSPAVPTTPTKPKGASIGRREAAAAGPARAVAVVASRANPPRRRREESGERQLLIRDIRENFVNNCHTA